MKSIFLIVPLLLLITQAIARAENWMWNTPNTDEDESCNNPMLPSVYTGCFYSTLYDTMNKMQRWLRDYERLRLNPDAPNESWTFSKYDIEGMHWTELQQIYLPELGMCWGPACSASRKSWYAYKKLGQQQQYRKDIGFRINRIQRAMGIPLTEFSELDPRWVDEQLTEEEIQLRPEEEEDDW